MSNLDWMPEFCARQSIGAWNLVEELRRRGFIVVAAEGPAQAGETRSAKTEGLGPQGEHAVVRQDDAPKGLHSHPATMDEES